MATYQNLVDGALRLVNRLGSGDSPTSTESADYLIVLNEFIDAMTARLGPIYEETTDSVTWTGGQASRTIGTSGNFNVARPQKILAAYFRDSGGSDNAMDVISHQAYQGVSSKTLSVQFPQYLAYNPTFTSSLGTLFIWPIPPSDATIRIVSKKPLAAVSALSNTVTLPPGYQEMFRYNLSLRFAPENGRESFPFVYKNAEDTLWAIERANDTTEEMVLDPMAPGGRGGVDEINLYTTDT